VSTSLTGLIPALSFGPVVSVRPRSGTCASQPVAQSAGVPRDLLRTLLRPGAAARRSPLGTVLLPETNLAGNGIFR